MGAKRIRYAETAELMDEALLILLKKKPYDRVTVTDICAKAGVNRSTFYLHYDTIDDLLEETLESAIEKLVAKYPSIIRPVEQCEEEELHLYTPDYLMPYLAFARENRDLLVLASKHKNYFIQTILSLFCSIGSSTRF